jgi:hypothetical protein
MALPLIFFHQGFEPYLAFTLWQARQTNPRSPVYLLGDDTNDLSSIGVKHFPFRDCAGRAGEFVAAYRHLSGHELACERLCFERWFYLDAFLQKSGIQEFCFFDSDVFLLMDLEELRPGWAGFELAGTPAWGFCYCVRADIIARFCDFMLDRFRDEAQVRRWEAAHRAGGDKFPPENIYNVSDMLLWMMFMREAGFRHLDLRVPRDGLVFDYCIDVAQDFRMRNGFKEFAGHNGAVFGYHEKAGQPVRFAALHLGGKYPKRLGPMFTGWPAALVRACSRPRYLRNWRKLAQMAVYSHRWRNKLVTTGAEPGGLPHQAA